MALLVVCVVVAVASVAYGVYQHVHGREQERAFRAKIEELHRSLAASLKINSDLVKLTKLVATEKGEASLNDIRHLYTMAGQLHGGLTSMFASLQAFGEKYLGLTFHPWKEVVESLERRQGVSVRGDDSAGRRA